MLGQLHQWLCFWMWVKSIYSHHKDAFTFDQQINITSYPHWPIQRRYHHDPTWYCQTVICPDIFIATVTFIVKSETIMICKFGELFSNWDKNNHGSAQSLWNSHYLKFTVTNSKFKAGPTFKARKLKAKDQWLLTLTNNIQIS